MRSILSLILLCTLSGYGQTMIQLNKGYENIPLTRGDTLDYTLHLEKDGVYQFSIYHNGIAVYYSLSEERQIVFESNYPDDITGYEKFEYRSQKSGEFKLKIYRFDDPENTESGTINVFIKSLSDEEVAVRRRIRDELKAENSKNVTTVDIDHFWVAFDKLKDCKHYADSVEVIQKEYLDKATNGLIDFIQVREFTAEKFVEIIAKNIDYYRSIRKNSYLAKEMEPVINEVFKRFSELYPLFKPFKVCFAIGIKNTGGTVSDRFVLIGTEVAVFQNNGEDIREKLKRLVAHECGHTQQKPSRDPEAVKCPLLYQSIREGACDFMAELITGNENINEYGRKNESKLWSEFKNELCNQDIGNWLYNSYRVKDKPSDLGYYIGYEICKSYYDNCDDKRDAISEIIGMDDPVLFLVKSGYDKKVKN
ncbi:MAG: hypothetical protein KF870_15160 [Leadbetterella sp.]|nr:hypothetical protein [Leadbetterella sp.]